jgi:putative ABC transport system permease protein
MFLALAEMRRAKVRFGLLTGAVALLVFLVLFLQTLQNGLITAFVGAIKNNSAPVFVYSVDGRRNLQGGVILPQLEQQVRAVDGVGRVGELGQGTFTVRTKNEGDEDAAIIGYQADGLGTPAALSAGRFPSAPGEAVASASDESIGLAIGDTVEVAPGGLVITVVGQAENVQLSVTPTLFVPYETYLAAVAVRNPDGGAPLPNALVVEPAPGVSDGELVDRINAVSDDLDALTRSDAAAGAPGVSQVQLSFNIIFVLLAVVVPFVTGLFFLIVTFQKANALTLLRAIGAPARKLVWSLLVQVGIVTAGGILIGTALYTLLVSSGGGGNGISLSYQGGAVTFWSILLFVFSLASSLLAARRVLAIDPVLATTGAGVGK